MIKLIIRKSFKFYKVNEDKIKSDTERETLIRRKNKASDLNFEDALSYIKINKKFIKELFDKPNFQKNYKLFLCKINSCTHLPK